MPTLTHEEEEALFVPPPEDIAIELSMILSNQHKKGKPVDVKEAIKEITEVFPGLKATGGEKMTTNPGIRIVSQETDSGYLSSVPQQNDAACCEANLGKKPRGRITARRSQPPSPEGESKASGGEALKELPETAKEGIHMTKEQVQVQVPDNSYAQAAQAATSVITAAVEAYNKVKPTAQAADLSDISAITNTLSGLSKDAGEQYEKLGEQLARCEAAAHPLPARIKKQIELNSFGGWVLPIAEAGADVLGTFAGVQEIRRLFGSKLG